MKWGSWVALPLRKLTWLAGKTSKHNHERRCISYWKWGFSNVMLVNSGEYNKHVFFGFCQPNFCHKKPYHLQLFPKACSSTMATSSGGTGRSVVLGLVPPTSKFGPFFRENKVPTLAEKNNYIYIYIFVVKTQVCFLGLISTFTKKHIYSYSSQFPPRIKGLISFFVSCGRHPLHPWLREANKVAEP